MVDGGAGAVAEEDSTCLEIGDAKVEAVNVVSEFGYGRREVRSSEGGAPKGTAKKANAGGDFRGSIAMRG